MNTVWQAEGSKIVMPALEKILKEKLIDDSFGRRHDVDFLNDTIVVIDKNTVDEGDIPNIPYAVSVNTDSSSYVVIDVRPFVRSKDGTVSNSAEVDMLLANVYLESLWNNESYNEVERTVGFAGGTFVRAFGKQVSMLYRLENADMLLLKVLLALKWKSNFIEGYDDEERLIGVVAIMLMMDYNDVKPLFDKLGKELLELSTWNEVIGFLNKHAENKRLSKIKSKVLLEIFLKLFFGPNSKDKLLTGMDHPPVWASVVYAAANDKRYKRTLLAMHLMTSHKREKEQRDVFVKALDSHVKDLKKRLHLN
jgi:hypothetical protein